ncbi:MAG TPA: type I phosphomannose isomerase catalytic subunit [Candidatus Acidoferrales bacterium]|nr:type I phosphomannose isomerase catalytic subunit [Candidatus Acidoferrales bacterium]
MALRPVRLEPIFVPRIWGARNLAPLFPEMKSLREPIGEVWLTGNECRFAGGPFAGQKLGETWPQMSEEWAGENARRDKPFPVLVKFLFPEDKLSVQVHPDDEYAAKNEAAAGGVGKTEMWYVISARPGAEVRVGLRESTTRGGFRRAIAEGNAEEHVERVAVQAGDAIFVPAGTVHTIGPGMILCEVQENSDLTYRVYDYNRRTVEGKLRELHVEKAMDVIRFGKQQSGKVGQELREDSSSGITILADCPYFSVVKHTISESRYLVKPKGRLEIIVILEGRGELCTNLNDERVEYGPAEAWVIPAAVRDCIYDPQKTTTLLSIAAP